MLKAMIIFTFIELSYQSTCMFIAQPERCEQPEVNELCRPKIIFFVLDIRFI